MISASLLEEEETQIAGVATIIDHEGITMKHTSLFSVTDIVDFADCLKNAVGRYKQLFLVNLPTFAVFLLDVARSTLSDKLKKRIVLPKSVDDLKNYIDPSLLPKVSFYYIHYFTNYWFSFIFQEYGGTLTEAEHMEIFNEYFKGIRPNLEKLRAKVVDWNKVPSMKLGPADNVGSFRRLEID